MSAGTITLTNKSSAVSGAGTTFTTDLKAGDIIVSVVGGVTYTLPVKTVDSATGVTLLKNYDGPTQAGAAWSAVPRDTMNAITAQLAAETAQALRGLNYDKQNWQLVFSSNGNITVRLPDGSTFSGPSWNSIVSALNEKADKSALGWWATANPSKMENVNATLTSAKNPFAGIGFYNSPTAGGPTTYGTALQTYLIGGGGMSFFQEAVGSVSNAVRLFARNIVLDNAGNATFGNPVTIRHSGNTTVASDGTLKTASPIVNIFDDGAFETNEESNGAQVERVSAGVYRITNVLGMNSDGAWGGVDGGFDVPKDHNGQRLIWLDYEVEADGSILIKTYHRTYPDAPVFARNIKDGYEESAPIDIPSDQFLSVRVEMPQDSIWNRAQRAAQEEMEQEKTTEE